MICPIMALTQQVYAHITTHRTPALHRTAVLIPSLIIPFLYPKIPFPFLYLIIPTFCENYTTLEAMN